MRATFLLVLILGFTATLLAQVSVGIQIDSIQNEIGSAYAPGMFYVPRTAAAQEDFLNNGIRQNAIRLNVIEGALNNTTNLDDCIAYLDAVSDILKEVAGKTDKLIFILDKMPAWLSSSSDGSPAETPGWFVLNTKPPANYADWEAMIRRVTDRIINDYGISNAYFEIWNEPALGSWTGTKEEYFELFERTYDAVKSVDSSAPVGGPGTNHWGRNLDFDQPYGYLSNAIGDRSLIGQLIDSTEAWGKPLDFVTWHDFSLNHQTTRNAVDYITQKYTGLGKATPPLMIGEWNTPSSVRDTPVQKSFFVKNQMEMAKTAVDNNMVAAWQDFEPSPREFHAEYGLLTYGDIHKPVYKAMLLTHKVGGSRVLNTSNEAIDIITSVSNDTLNVLVTNYTLPAFLEAFNHTLFTGRFNASQIDSAGYISILTNDFRRLDSIYRGLTTIPGVSRLDMAINSSISVYQHFDKLSSRSREISLNVIGTSGLLTGESYTIDSTSNNTQFRYDSLVTQGFTQADAVAEITNDQSLVSAPVTLINGKITFSLQPNAVQLLQFDLMSATSIESPLVKVNVRLYPNPAEETFSIECDKIIGRVQIVDSSGKIVEQFVLTNKHSSVNFADYPPGVYFVTLVDLMKTVKLVRK